MIEVFQYALLPESFISGTQIASILRSMKAMQYKDINIARMVMEKLKTKEYYQYCRIQDPVRSLEFKDLADLPMAGRKGFYPGRRMIDPEYASKKLSVLMEVIINTKEMEDGEII